MPIENQKVRITVNGRPHAGEVEPRTLLVDFIRENLHLTGTHVGCAHGSCGACTVLIDGRAGRSCTTLALQVDGADILTVESLARPEGPLSPIQQAFHECHALQCGYCTPGFLMATTQLLREHPDPTDAQIRAGLSGNLCRCTGYVNIVRAVKLAAQKLKADA
jgi:aerobic carbon-monoxide dehydrogenase small subunit